MADSITEFTLKLARHLLVVNGQVGVVSISGFVGYLTLLLVDQGLRGPAKDHLSEFLDCNYSFIGISYTNDLEFECQNIFRMDEFRHIGSVKSAIFHSQKSVETFKQMALEFYDMEFQEIEPFSNTRQYYIITEWANSLRGVPMNDILVEPYGKELSLLMINEYTIRFQWRTPFLLRSTKKVSFTDITNKEHMILMMRMVDYFKFYNDLYLKASVVFIPLVDQDIFAAAVLPDEDNNVIELLKNMNVRFVVYSEQKNEYMVS
ncbi:hypothetical protein RF11_09880 [Thelohanellus kitauei]|uniref:Serpin domain-containing protein n=1 Tax=Thelohanellus kitauei TaxID=669202 RepID=A0A0C2MQV5_THEKT|nr:hypothetical protein RF11_09880 [Thelohanellus kitauei]